MFLRLQTPLVKITWLALRLTLAALLAPLIAAVEPSSALAEGGSLHAVYVMSNAVDGNEILVFTPDENGAMGSMTAVPTGGRGTGTGLGSQGALILSADHRMLFSANAGSGEISVFAARRGDLELLSVVPSGGETPISLTVHSDLLYVLNAGGSGGITGFRISPRGELSPIPGSSQPLSNAGTDPGTGPAQISFSPDGKYLVVTEKESNQILTYAIDPDGRASAPEVHPSAGMTPFGFDFNRRGYLIVTEAFGGAPDASAVSSYALEDGRLRAISPSTATGQTAACWLVTTHNGKYAYATNTGSGSVSGYRVDRNGNLTLLDPDGRTGETGEGSAPADVSISASGQFLFVLSGGTNTLTAFAIHSGGTDAGSLTRLAQVNIPAGSAGLAVD